MNIHRYFESDAVLISEFMHRCFLNKIMYKTRTHSSEYYTWKYNENPWGKPIVWVAENFGKIIGTMAVVPKLLWIEGETQYCGESGDTFIDPEFRGKNVFIEIATHVFNDCKQAGIQMIYGIPNRISFDVVTKLFDYKELFTYRSFIRPICFSSLVKQAIRNDILSVMLSWPIELLYRNLYKPKDVNSIFSLEQIQTPDERFDILWSKLQSRVKFSVVKNNSYVTWRFFNNPESYRVMFIRRENEVAGLAVFKLTYVRGLICGHVVDLTITLESEEWPILWYCLLNELKKLNADFVNTWIPISHPQAKMMKRIGFIMRKKPYWMVMRGMNKSLSFIKGMDDPKQWTFSQADTDNI